MSIILCNALMFVQWITENFIICIILFQYYCLRLTYVSSFHSFSMKIKKKLSSLFLELGYFSLCASALRYYEIYAHCCKQDGHLGRRAPEHQLTPRIIIYLSSSGSNSGVWSCCQLGVASTSSYHEHKSICRNLMLPRRCRERRFYFDVSITYDHSRIPLV